MLSGCYATTSSCLLPYHAISLPALIFVLPPTIPHTLPPPYRLLLTWNMHAFTHYACLPPLYMPWHFLPATTTTSLPGSLAACLPCYLPPLPTILPTFLQNAWPCPAMTYRGSIIACTCHYLPTTHCTAPCAAPSLPHCLLLPALCVLPTTCPIYTAHHYLFSRTGLVGFWLVCYVWQLVGLDKYLPPYPTTITYKQTTCLPFFTGLGSLGQQWLYHLSFTPTPHLQQHTLPPCLPLTSLPTFPSCCHAMLLNMPLHLPVPCLPAALNTYPCHHTLPTTCPFPGT